MTFTTFHLLAIQVPVSPHSGIWYNAGLASEGAYSQPGASRVYTRNTGKLGYDGPCISSMCHTYMTDFAYDGPIFMVPLSPSYPSSPV